MPQFNQVIIFDSDEAMQKKWTAFCKKVSADNDFSAVSETIDVFLSEPFAAVLEEKDFIKPGILQHIAGSKFMIITKKKSSFSQ